MADTRYTRDHEWARLEDDGTITVGLTDHGQEALGEVVSVELPATDREVVEGESVATIGSARAETDVFAPLGGRVTEVNEALGDDPGLVNRDAGGEGWLWRMEPADEAEFETLLDEEAYETLLDAS